jgi:hypothetical protein
MSDSGQQLASQIVADPTGYKGTLVTAQGRELPVQTYEQGSGTELVLVVLADLDGRPAAGTDPATLEYTTVRGIVRLHGEAVFERHAVVRFVTEGNPEVIQRRAFVRVHTPQAVTLLDGAQHAEQAYTIDLSGGGMLLSRVPALALGDTIAFEIELGEDVPLIEGVARVVRVEEGGRRALAFEQIEERDRQRLIRFVFALMRESRARTRGDHL